MLAANDQLVHPWDLARATGQTMHPDEAVSDQILAFTENLLQDSMRGPDRQAPFGPAVEPGPGADAITRLVMFCGRTP